MSDRTLVLLRHAKAEHTPGVRDPDRRLTRRGHDDSAAAGAWLAAQGLVPDLVVCSPSRRTRETWRAVARALGAEAATTEDQRIYNADDGEDLLEVVTETDDSVRVLLMVGHNPTMSELAELLDPGGGPEDGLRTAGIAVHDVPGGWSACGPGTAPLRQAHTARAG
jgi:phosphohistidine phosphatase